MVSKNKLAIVTGGTRGIGAAISAALKKSGFNVVANYARDEGTANNFTKNTKIKAVKWDICNFNDCITNVAQIEKEFNTPIAILVNNAGITLDSMMHKMPYENWQTVINTNLTSCFNMTSACIKSMREHNYGRIINISSINGQMGQIGQTNYAAAKAGIIAFSKSLAKENAGKGITVNVVAPGYIKTNMTDTIPHDIIEKIITNIPVKRLGKPEEVARTVTFLADKNSGFITGETISVNGGHYM